MIHYINFSELNILLQEVAPNLASIVMSSRDPRLDIHHLEKYCASIGHLEQWKPVDWWSGIEVGVHVEYDVFFQEWIPEKQYAEDVFIVLTMDSWSTGRIYKLPARVLKSLHDNYANHSGTASKFFQMPLDYIAINVNKLKAYVLFHEGYTFSVKIG